MMTVGDSGMTSRIIFVATTIEADLGGIARSVPSLAGALAHVVGLPENPEEAGQDNKAGNRTNEVILLAPKAEPNTLGSIKHWVKDSGLNVCLCDGFRGVSRELEKLTRDPVNVSFIYHAGVWSWLNHVVAKLGRRKGIPVIVSTRSMLDPWALNHRKWKKRLAWHAYAKRDLLGAAAIHATAELEARYIREALGKKCPPVIVVPNGVDLPEEEFLSRSHGVHGESLSKKLKLRDLRGSVRDTPRRILFLSRIHEKKGVLDLVRAFGQLNPEGWELVVAGNDDSGHQALCEKVARKQPNVERISFPGAISDADKWDLYRSADLFVLPSYSENFGIVVGEALGMGIPVITTTATPWRQYALAEGPALQGTAGQEVSEKNFGLRVVEPGVEPLKWKLKVLMAHSDEERAAAGARGAAWIRRRFSWEAIGRKFLEEVESVLNARHVTGG